MYQKILVALDNSAAAEAVFNAALTLAQGTGACLLLVHSLSGQEEGSPLPFTMDSIYWAPGSEVNLELWHQEWVRYETESLERLRQFAHRAEAVGVTGEFRQLVGEPGKVLCKAAQSWGADLVVLGNRGRSGLSQALLGSVSNYALHHAPCSVLVLKGKSLERPEGVAASELQPELPVGPV
jgi:nucleotide-binding universal stress UspA family protein